MAKLNFYDNIKKELSILKEENLFRTVKDTSYVSPRIIKFQDKELLQFSSNDYLGLSQHEEILNILNSNKITQAGSTGSRLILGNSESHIKLETKIKEFKNSEAALLFNSGYQANTGVLPALVTKDDEIFADKLIHASLIDGCRLSRAKFTRFPHQDLEVLEDKLKKSTARTKLIVTDGVFSMDGDLPKVNDMLFMARMYDAYIYLDDAHGMGCLGKNGRGTLDAVNIKKDERIIEMATFGKAFGTYGAFVTGSQDLIDYLINKARTFIYSTALPPIICEATIKAIEISDRDWERRGNMYNNLLTMNKMLRKENFDTGKSETQIIPIIIGSEEKAIKMSEYLFSKNIFVPAIRYPTVEKNKARLRITLTSEHTRDDLDLLLETLKEAREACL